MTDPMIDGLGGRVQFLAAGLRYPPTPDVAGRVRARLATRVVRRPARRVALAVGLLVLTSLLLLAAAPQARAALANLIQIGVVRIFLVTPTATPTPTPPPAGTPPPTAAPTPTLLSSLLDLAGQTTLADARRRAGFAIPLPAYPADLGAPDAVFLQQFDTAMAVLVWMDPAKPDQVRLSLQILSSGSFAVAKVQPTVVQTTTVNGGPAVWAEGPYLLELKNADVDLRRLINGHVLIWQSGGLTYRLETAGPLDEAIRIAESLR